MSICSRVPTVTRHQSAISGLSQWRTSTPLDFSRLYSSPPATRGQRVNRKLVTLGMVSKPSSPSADAVRARLAWMAWLLAR